MLPSTINAVGVAHGPFGISKPRADGNISEWLTSIAVPLLTATVPATVRSHVRLLVCGSVARPTMARYWGKNAEWCCIVVLDQPSLAEMRSLTWKPTNGTPHDTPILSRHLAPYVYACGSTVELLDALSGEGPSAALLHPSHLDSRAPFWGASILNGFIGFAIDATGKITVNHEGSWPGRSRWADLVKVLKEGQGVEGDRSGPFEVEVRESSERRLEFSVPLNLYTD